MELIVIKRTGKNVAKVIGKTVWDNSERRAGMEADGWRKVNENEIPVYQNLINRYLESQGFDADSGSKIDSKKPSKPKSTADS